MPEIAKEKYEESHEGFDQPYQTLKPTLPLQQSKQQINRQINEAKSRDINPNMYQISIHNRWHCIFQKKRLMMLGEEVIWNKERYISLSHCLQKNEFTINKKCHLGCSKSSQCISSLNILNPMRQELPGFPI